MVAASRQKRLNTLFGAPDISCLRVFALVNERGYSEDKFKELVQKHQIEVNEGTGSGYFDPDLDPFELPYEGMVRKEKDGSHYFFNFSLQSVFMTLDKKLVERLSHDNDALHQSDEVVHQVAQSYKDPLQHVFPDLELKTPVWARTNNLTVKFYFAIQPYQFSLHNPRDMDVLKPITIIDGHTIEPSSTSVDPNLAAIRAL